MEYGVIAIVVICIFILAIGALKKKSKMVFNFFFRAVLGLICIYFCNEFLKMQQIELAVGLNTISFLTTGSLGLSGVALLYGIMLYQIL